MRSYNHKEKFGTQDNYTGKSEPSTRKDENSIKSDIMPNLKRVTPNSSVESRLYQKAEEIAQKSNIKIFKGPKNQKSDFFKIFFFNESPNKKVTCDGKAKAHIRPSGFNHPSQSHLSNSDSEYLIIRIFTSANKVEVEDSNYKKTLESRIGVDVELQDQGNVMSLDTQIKSLVAHWLELSNKNAQHVQANKLF